jgi:hypothetical protein
MRDWLGIGAWNSFILNNIGNQSVKLHRAKESPAIARAALR